MSILNQSKKTAFWGGLLGAVIISGSAVFAQQQPSSHVDYPAFASLTTEAQQYRQSRLVDVKTFLKMAQDPKTLILDTRSANAYQRKHIKGAKHLNFSDFTADKLAKIIPDPQTRILIYCNNNIDADPANFALKSAPLALNIPTFINLYGYGYKNVYELADLISADGRDIPFAGTAVQDEARLGSRSPLPKL